MDSPIGSQSHENLSARYLRVPTAVVSDVLSTMGFMDQVVSSKIRAVFPSAPFAGPALCLFGREGTEPKAANNSKPVFEMDRHVTRGCVAVIDTHEHERGAVVGGNVGLSWRLRGCVGVVTDGGIRDADEFREMGLPVCASFVGPMSNKGLWAFHGIGVPITLPGQRGDAVNIHQGDMVHADFDGVVIVPARLAELVVADAEILEQMESKIRSDLEKGHDREEVYSRYDRFAHIKKVSSS